MKRLATALALAGALAAALASRPALAWGSDGHRVVGAIAAQLIAGSSAEQHVAALLLPGETLELATVWADCIKPTAPASCGARSEEMNAFAAANPGHAGFHYADLPFQVEHYQDHALGTRADDLVQILRQAIGVLQGRLDTVSNPHHFTQRQALLMVAHLAGDLHQPLHISGAYVARDGGFATPTQRSQLKDGSVFDTRGGQDLLVDGEHGLHNYWDHVLVAAQLRRAGAESPQQFARQAIEAGPALEPNLGEPAGWPYQWADTSLAAAKQVFQGVTLGPMTQRIDQQGVARRAWPLKLPAGYEAAGGELVRAELIQGGYHLAALLKAIWP